MQGTRASQSGKCIMDKECVRDLIISYCNIATRALLYKVIWKQKPAGVMETRLHDPTKQLAAHEHLKMIPAVREFSISRANVNSVRHLGLDCTAPPTFRPAPITTPLSRASFAKDCGSGVVFDCRRLNVQVIVLPKATVLDDSDNESYRRYSRLRPPGQYADCPSHH
ncbi:hypothetical protein K431DRAFT_117591 [Polychaeton citri CBS 116435]|uniref:Uncharacterized protein n=1 Tax=Polychaeton citri CBS 116435 TaxID=1314669 RepID=A0A9P4QHM2_9PEZI|nr:hypothetical protein K431DRAFT_117591 [Polychaeton citri CBS 116435]